MYSHIWRGVSGQGWNFYLPNDPASSLTHVILGEPSSDADIVSSVFSRTFRQPALN
jgi:hypothetical protein